MNKDFPRDSSAFDEQRTSGSPGQILQFTSWAPEHRFWWFRLASFRYTSRRLTKEQAEHERRADNAAVAILAFIVLTFPLDTQVVVSTPTAFLAIAVNSVYIIAIFLNRSGLTIATGVLLTMAWMVGAASAPIVLTSSFNLDELSDFCLISLAIIVASFTLPIVSIWIVMAGNILISVAEFFLVPHAPNLTLDLLPPSYPSVSTGVITLLGFGISMNLGIAVLSYLGVLGYNQALERQYIAIEQAEKMGLIASLAEQSSQQHSLGYEYYAAFISGIQQCLTDRTNGIHSRVSLDMSTQPQNQYEASIRRFIASEAQRLNLYLEQLDRKASAGTWSLAQFIMVLRQYASTLASTLQSGQPARLDLDNFAPHGTGYPIMDTLIVLVRAVLVSSEAEQMMTSRYGQLSPSFVKRVKGHALAMYGNTNWNMLLNAGASNPFPSANRQQHGINPISDPGLVNPPGYNSDYPPEYPSTNLPGYPSRYPSGPTREPPRTQRDMQPPYPQYPDFGDSNH